MKEPLSIAEKERQVVGIVVSDHQVDVPIFIQVGEGEIDRVLTSGHMAERGEPALAVASEDGEQGVAATDEIGVTVVIHIASGHRRSLHRDRMRNKKSVIDLDR